MMRYELFLLVIALASAAANPTPSNLQNLCNGINIQLETTDDLDRLQLGSDGIGCPSPVLDAIKDLQAIATNRTACTMQKAEAITQFADKYLKDPAQNIPKQLADFAIAYGMQVSGVCSHEMLERFSPEADARLYKKLGPQRYGRFANFKKYLVESPIGVALSPIVKTGEVVLPADLIQVMPELGAFEFALPEASTGSQTIANICRNFLQPLYEPILLPLAHLLRAGFKSKDNFRRKQMKEDGRFWSTAVFLCESLKTVEVKNIEEGQQVVDAGALPDVSDDLAKVESDDESVQLVDSLPMEEYQTSHEVGDKVLSSSVKSLVKSFDANRNEVERLRKRIVSRSLRVMQVLYKKGKYGPMVRQALSSIRLKEGANSKEFEEARGAILKLVEAPDEDINTLVTSSSNSGVHERKGAARSKKLITFKLLWVIVGSFGYAFILACLVITALVNLIFGAPHIGLKKWATMTGEMFASDMDFWTYGLISDIKGIIKDRKAARSVGLEH